LERPKRILIVCGTAIATSTVVAYKVGEILKKHGIKAEIKKELTSAAKVASRDADLIISTTQVPDVKVPVISGIPFITGMGIDKLEKEIIEKLQSIDNKNLKKEA
jgi:PTS system galactitol-specific IIB component